MCKTTLSLLVFIGRAQMGQEMMRKRCRLQDGTQHWGYDAV